MTSELVCKLILEGLPFCLEVWKENLRKEEQAEMIQFDPLFLQDGIETTN